MSVKSQYVQWCGYTFKFISAQRRRADQLGLGERFVFCLFPKYVSRFPTQILDQSEHAKQTTQPVSLTQCDTGLSTTTVNVIAHNAAHVGDRWRAPPRP